MYLERPAIKVLHVQMDTETQEQFRRETGLIAHVHHSHIVSVLDFGIQEQTLYLVMEYTAGGMLREKHPSGTCLSLEQIVLYTAQVASALDYAHQQHIPSGISTFLQPTQRSQMGNLTHVFVSLIL